METQGQQILFTGSVNPMLAEQIADELGLTLGNVELSKFANGEIYARFAENVRGKEVFLVQPACMGSGMDVNDALMELLIMASAAKLASARSVAAVVAHYGYSRQDRKALPREPITARLVSDLMKTAGIDKLVTIDLHQDAIQGFFSIPVTHISALPLFADHFKSMGLDPSNLVAVSPDISRAKTAKKFSTMLGCDIAIIHKDKPNHEQAEVTTLIGDVNGKTCILVDDMIDTASVLVSAAEVLRERGASRIYACATHGLFSEPALKRIEDSCIEKAVVTNTVPLPAGCQSSKIHVLSVAPPLAKTIRNMWANSSVSSLSCFG